MAKRRKSYQIQIFILTYLTYSILHINRESWSILKPKIQYDENISSSQLGAMDTVFLSVYSLGLFVSGSLGDHYSPKMLLIFSYIGVTIIITLIAVTALSGWSNPVIFCILFSLNGFMQSFGWPSCCAIFANWFGKRGRGALIGVWASCSNFGNIVGALLTSFLTSSLSLNWETSYLLIGLLCLINAVVNLGFLVVHPEDKGIVIEEIDEKLN